MQGLKYNIFIRALGLILAMVCTQPAWAGNKTALNANFILAGLSVDNQTTRLEKARLFGVSAKPYADTRAFTKWHSVLARFDYEFERGINTYQGQAWAKFLSKLKGQNAYTQARAVNAYFNRIKFRDDAKNWGQKDMWATPFEFMQRGGDCEDYAVAKYISLRALGVAENALHLTVVFDHATKLPHAILVLRAKNGQNWILDNQTPRLAPAQLLQTRYQPIFGLNQKAWWHYGV
jgi:predicted transglutaminase-like cysteine proteinase